MMATLISTIYDSITILDQFLAHYRAIGVEQFVFNINESFVPGIAARAQSILERYGVTVAHVSGTPQNWIQQNRQRNASQAACTREDDWVVIADLDEFHEYPLGLAETLRAAEAQGYDCLYGQLVDRLAPDGELIPMREDVSVFEQFPIQCHITHEILKAPDWKIVALKGRIFPVGTCVPHDVMRDTYAARPYTGFGIISHHFKWHAEVLKKLRRRVDFYQRQFAQGDVRFSCYKETANILDHLARYGRVRLDVSSDPR